MQASTTTPSTSLSLSSQHPGPGPGPAPPALNATLPSPSTQMHIAEARTALVASMSNLLDSELQSRAAVLHANAAQLSRQERDVQRATEGLRKENEKLARAARDAGRKIKETGNVQNWAEVLERDFLVLEETVRLARRGRARGDASRSRGGSRSGSETGSGSSYWSGSEEEGSRGDGDDEGANAKPGAANGAPRTVEDVVVGANGLMDGGGHGKTNPGPRIRTPGVEGEFADVSSAVARGIMEAMATNLDDFETTAAPPTLGGGQPIGCAVEAGVDKVGDVDITIDRQAMAPDMDEAEAEAEVEAATPQDALPDIDPMDVDVPEAAVHTSVPATAQATNADEGMGDLTGSHAEVGT
jgi:hypothetical protein